MSSSEMPPRFDGKWFHEFNTMWPGQAMSIEIEECIVDMQTKYQHLQIFKTKTYGMMMVLDGVIQSTSRDEHSYHEMIAHLPLFSHPNPKKVLVIGGGDGGVLREIVKHKSVEEAHLCDIDGDVIEQSKKHFPHLACGFDHPKVHVHVMDGFKFMDDHKDEFDVIITDSSDPVGPAAALFEQPYYLKMKNALRKGGIVCTQGECQWLHLDLIGNMIEFCHKLYPSVAYGFTTIPTYPSGQIGFVLCSLDSNVVFDKPMRVITDKETLQWGLKYYNSGVHSAAFVLPNFAKEKLSKHVPKLVDSPITRERMHRNNIVEGQHDCTSKHTHASPTMH